MTIFKGIEFHLYTLRNWRKRVFMSPYLCRFAIGEDDPPHHIWGHGYELSILGICLHICVPLKKKRLVDWDKDSVKSWPNL